MQFYRFSFFGGLRFESGAAVITRFRTQKTASLLAYLALHRGLQPREVLADLLWPGDEPGAARHSLRMAFSSLRRQLESDLQTESQTRESLFEATRFAIGLRAGAVWCDVAAFDEAMQNARNAPDLAARAQFYNVAAALYTGEFLPGFYDDWCLEIAARIQVAHEEATQFLSQHSAPNFAARAAATLSGSPNVAPRVPMSATTTAMATLLLFDGAPLSAQRKKQWLGDSGVRLASAVESALSPQIWRFSGASAAAHGELGLRADETVAPRRIAICTGELTQNDGGALLQRALGLLESAHAGQTLCCEATALFERGRAGVACRELGAFHLPRALPGTAPERIFQINRAGQSALDFDAPHAQPARGAFVPRPLDPFFGRESELQKLRALLAHKRLVTLAGAGGAGKTRLALQLAARLESERGAPFGGAVFWVALADVPDANGIAAAICDALRLEIDAAQDAWQGATAALHRAPATLLVLDNFEHLVEDGAAQIEELLARAPDAHCLITSRQLLGAHGEIEFALSPLPVAHLAQSAANLESLRAEPSVALFCDRARAVRPDFALTARNAASIAALCGHLEGLPLAIELAAARAGSLAPAQILEHLRQYQSATGDAEDAPTFGRLDFLHNAARTAPARHRTLRTTLSWSFEQLEPKLQTLLCRLCAFRGGGTAPATSHVCRVPDAAHALEELRAHSLLVRAYDENDDARYAMLETVRQFAFEVAQERGELEGMWRNHAHYFLEWAQNEAPNAIAPDAAARLRSWGRIRADADNLRAAIRRTLPVDPATSLQLILACKDFSGDHLSRLELDVAAALQGVEARSQSVAPAILAEAWSLAAIQAAHRGDFGAQTEFARLRLQQILDSKNAAPEALGWAYFHWGSALHRNNKTVEARVAWQQSLDLFAQLSAPHRHQCHAWTRIEMGNNAFDSGDLETAILDYEACHQAFVHSGDRDGQASALAQLADVLFHAQQHERAAQLWHRVGAIERELNDERPHEWRRHQEGKLAVAQGGLERGHALLVRALRSFASDGQKVGTLRSLLALSLFWLEREQPQRARQLLDAEAAERQKLDWAPDAGWQTLRAQLWERVADSAATESEPLDAIVERELN